MNSLKWLPVFFALVVVGCNERSSHTSTPSECLKNYYTALKSGDIVAAEKLLASSKHLPGDLRQVALQEFSEGAKADKLAILPVTFEEQIKGDCAAVICKGNNTHIDDFRAAYFIEEGGAWKALVNLTVWDEELHGLTDEQKEHFKSLERWFEDEKSKLKR